VKKAITLLVFFVILFFSIPSLSDAHPGNTASDGCHYCRTNCDSWGVAWNQRHCHNSRPSPDYLENTSPEEDGSWDWVLWALGIGGVIWVGSKL